MALAEDLLIVHSVITRALSVAHERGREFAAAGFGDAGAEKGYRDFSRCLVKLVKAHHDGEEAIVFPRLRPLLPSVPFADLEKQHHDLVGSLDAAESALDAAEAGAPAATWLDRLLPALGRARETWTAHIAVEEDHFTPAALDGALDSANQAEILESRRGAWPEARPPSPAQCRLRPLQPASCRQKRARRQVPSAGRGPGPWPVAGAVVGDEALSARVAVSSAAPK